jgi:hypothetical protein
MALVNTAVQCQACTAPVNEQYWQNVEIKLSAAYKNFGSTVYQVHGATNTKPTTSDGGKTWVIQKITIPVFTPVAE